MIHLKKLIIGEDTMTLIHKDETIENLEVSRDTKLDGYRVHRRDIMILPKELKEVVKSIVMMDELREEYLSNNN